MKRVLLLDCDGVLADFVTPVLERIEHHCGQRFTHNDITTWEIFDSIQVPGIKEKVWEDVAQPGFCERIPPFREALVSFARIAKIVDITIVTSPWPSPTWKEERTAWLAKYFGIPPERVLHEKTKDHVPGDYFVDDKLSHVVAWKKNNPHGLALLWPTPHNQRDYWPQRLESWAHLESVCEANKDYTERELHVIEDAENALLREYPKTLEQQRLIDMTTGYAEQWKKTNDP